MCRSRVWRRRRRQFSPRPGQLSQNLSVTVTSQSSCLRPWPRCLSMGIEDVAVGSMLGPCRVGYGPGRADEAGEQPEINEGLPRRSASSAVGRSCDCWAGGDRVGDNYRGHLVTTIRDPLPQEGVAAPPNGDRSLGPAHPMMPETVVLQLFREYSTFEYVRSTGTICHISAVTLTEIMKTATPVFRPVRPPRGKVR
jgi:hypothetical protein